jgi:hypothetical protein
MQGSVRKSLRLDHSLLRVLIVIQLSAGLSRRTATSEHRSSGEVNLASPERQGMVTNNQKYFTFYLNTPSFESSVKKVWPSKGRLKLQRVVD